MGRGLFDLVDEFNKRRAPGYSSFEPGYIDPQQALNMQAKANLMSTPQGAGPALIGNTTGGMLGSLVGAGVKKYRESRPGAKVAKHLSSAVGTALNEKTARILKENPGIPARQAIVAAAEELYASTAGSKQDPAFRDEIRNQAMQALGSMGEFDPEAQQKFGAARESNVKADAGPDLGTVKNFITPAGEMISIPEKAAAKLLMEGEDLGLVDTPSAPKAGDTIEAFEGDQRLTWVYDPEGLTGGKPNKQGWVKFSGDARAAAGGDEAPPGDQRTDAGVSKAQEDIQNNFVGLDTANEAMDHILKLVKEGEKENIPGVTGTVGAAFRGVGEAVSVVQSAAKLSASMFGANTKAYNNGTMTYSQLTAPSKYEKEFSTFAKGAELSQRTRATLINLAYLLAISQEASARAISDKDIAFRLQTIGAGISSGQTLEKVIEDRRKEMYTHLNAKLKYDPYFGNPDNPEAQFFKSKYDESFNKYYGAKPPRKASPSGPVPRPTVIFGPNGVEARGN